MRLIDADAVALISAAESKWTNFYNTTDEFISFMSSLLPSKRDLIENGRVFWLMFGQIPHD
jgi:hypothetical protein